MHSLDQNGGVGERKTFRHEVLFAALYFSEGAPVGFIWWALPTLLHEEGVAVEKSTALTAMLVLPWTFKFLWAPLVDTWQGSRWTLRHWIVAAQGVMVATLLMLTSLDFRSDFSLLGVLLVVHAVAAATQDVAIDALCISGTAPEERGRLNGWMQAGMLLGRSLFGGFGLVMAARFGQDAFIMALAVATGCSALLVMSRLGAIAPISQGCPDVSESVFAKLKACFQQPGTWAGLGFALTAGAGFEALGAVQGQMLVDHGMTKTDIGWMLAIPNVAAMLIGAVLGGMAADRWHPREAIHLGLVIFCGGICSIAGFVHFAATPLPTQTVYALFAIEAFGVGFFTAASYAWLMNLSGHTLAGTRFSMFMGATNGCESWAGFLVGRLVGQYGYPLPLLVMCLISLLSGLCVRRWTMNSGN